jgi:hypothetical protein
MPAPFKKVSATSVETKTNLAQTILSPGFNTLEEKPPEVAALTEEELVSALTEDISNSEQYNTVLDTELYRNTGKLIDRDKVRALKNENRFNAVQNKEDLENLKAAFKQGMAQSGWAATYSPDRHAEMHVFLIEYFGRNRESIAATEYASLRDLERDLLQQQSGAILAAAEMEVSRDSEGTPQDIDLRFVVEAINLYEDSFKDLDESDISVSSVLALGYSTLLDAESQNDAVIATLNKMDEETSYIEAALNRNLNEPLDITVGGRPKSYSLSEIWDNCFDCFHDKWNGDKDFKFGLEVEIRLKEVIASIKTVIDAIKLAIDIPGQVEANICSLMNLGVLCPIEIAFLIASLVSLARFVITENILGFKDFLSQLIGTILNPLFGALSTGLNLPSVLLVAILIVYLKPF